MKTLFRLSLPIVLVCSMAWFAACKQAESHNQVAAAAPREYDTITQAEVNLLEPGDIVLRRGNGPVSNFIADFLEEKYPITHCGIISQRQGRYCVISCESTPEVDGVIEDKLGNFVRNSLNHTMIAVRLKGPKEKRLEVLRQADWYLRTGKAFDLLFDMTDTTQYYCCEMLYHIFKRVYDKDLLPSKKKLVAYDVWHMDNFLNPENFEILFNHFEQK